MRAFARSISFGFAACFALGIADGGCGGTTVGAAASVDSGIPVAEGGDVPERGDAAPDAPAPPSEPLSVFGAYAARTVFLGETDRAGVPRRDAWKAYGENLDGIVSTKIPNGECKLVAGADSAKREDGNAGIDNSFGKTVLGFILSLVPTPTKTANDAIAKGGRTMILNRLPATPPGPESALSVSTTPAMNGRLVASGIAKGTFYYELPLAGSTWRIPIRHARVTMTVSADGLRAEGGILAGIIPTEELVVEIAKAAGRMSPQLCGGSTLDTIKQTIRQAADILVDGTQDPSKDCDAISIGIGFEATKVTATGVAPEPPPVPDPCQ